MTRNTGRRGAAALLILLIVFAPVAALASPPAVPDGLTAVSRVDRPAMWVADRVTFVVAISCPRGFDVLTEDLGRDRLKLSGFEVLGSETERRDDGAAIRYTIRYVLTTYKIDLPVLSIEPFPVRYYAARAGQQPDAAAPAGTVVVPGASVAFRSLLPDDQPADVRDERALPERWWPYRLLAPAGVALILVALVPFALLVFDRVRRARTQPAQPRPSPRQVRQAARVALGDLQGIDVSTPQQRRAAFARLDGLVRGHVADACGLATAALTTDEIVSTMERCASPPSIELVVALLELCERSQYAAPPLQPGEADWRDALARAGELLVARR